MSREALAERVYATAVRQMAARQLGPLPFIDFLSHVQIESDPEEGGTGGPIPFALYDYQRDRAEAWAAGRSECILKPRQIGFSWLAAAYMYWQAGFHKAAHVAAFSAGEAEVKKLVWKVAYIHDHLPVRYRAAGRVGITDATFASGSTITGYPATKKAGIGTTLALALFDEASYHEYLKDNQAAVVPALGDFGQLIMLSTSNHTLGEYGHFHDFYFLSKEGKTNCEAVFLPADIRPGRNAAWFAQERRKFTDTDTFDAFYPFSDSDAFKGRSGLVYPQFSISRHVGPSLVRWEDCLVRVAAYDMGGGDPTAIVMLGIWKDIGPNIINGAYHVHQFGEFYKLTGAPTDDEMADYIREWHKRAPLQEIEGDTAPGGAIVAASLNRLLGIKIRMEQQGRGEGLGTQGMFLEQGWLTIEPSCKQSIAEFAGYRWKESTDPTSKDHYATSTPHDHHADAMDARRKALVTIYRQIFQRQTGPRAVTYVRPKPGTEMTVAERVVALSRERERIERDAKERANGVH